MNLILVNLIVIGVLVVVVAAIIAIAVAVNKKPDVPKLLQTDPGDRKDSTPFGLTEYEDDWVEDDDEDDEDEDESDSSDDELTGSRVLEGGHSVVDKKARKAWGNKRFDTVVVKVDRRHHITPVQMASTSLEVEVTAAWFDDEEETPYAFSGECMIELMLEGKHPLYLGTGYIRDVDDEDQYGTRDYHPKALMQGYGEFGCIEDEDAEAWVRELCRIAGLRPPTFRQVMRKKNVSTTVRYFGCIEERGTTWYLLGYNASWVSDEVLYVQLERGGTRARVFLAGPEYTYPEIVFGVGEMAHRYELEERPAPSNDPQVVSNKPVITRTKPIAGQLDNDTNHYYSGGSRLVAYFCGEEDEGAADLEINIWEHPKDPPRCIELGTHHADGDFALSRDGRHAALICSDTEDGPKIVRVIDLDDSSETSFIAPDEWVSETLVLISAVGGEVALSLRDSRGRSWIRIYDRIGNIVRESSSIDGLFDTTAWTSRGILADRLEGYETSSDAYDDTYLDRLTLPHIWDTSRGDGPWERADHVGIPSPEGSYDVRVATFAYEFYHHSARTSERHARSGWDIQNCFNGDLGEGTWASPYHYLFIQDPWEIMDVRTGRVMSLVNEEVQENFYSFHLLDSNILIFEGEEEMAWAEFQIPAELDGDAGARDEPSGPAW